jgi:hypothetical protein
MSKVTVTGLLTSAITGGMVLGLTFSHFVAETKSQQPISQMEPGKVA